MVRMVSGAAQLPTSADALAVDVEYLDPILLLFALEPPIVPPSCLLAVGLHRGFPECTCPLDVWYDVDACAGCSSGVVGLTACVGSIPSSVRSLLSVYKVGSTESGAAT